MALTWNGRVSFVLTEALTLKRIKLLDVVLESATQEQGDDSFDVDVVLCTGELRRLIPDLLSALGGEVARGSADAAEQVVGAHAEPALA